MSAVTAGRIVPMNNEAEDAVSGSLVMDSQAIVNVAAWLKPGDYHTETNRWIYEAVLRLHERRAAIDPVTVADELERTGQLDAVGGIGKLLSLANNVPTSVHIEHYGRIVQRNAVRRRVLRAMEQGALLAQDDRLEIDELGDKVGFLVQEALSTDTGKELFRSLGDFIGDVFNEMYSETDPAPVVMTGLADLDNAMGGLMPGDMTVIAGRPGMGKTSLMDTIAYNMAQAGESVAFMSLEMKGDRIARRLIRMLTGIPSSRLRLPARVLRADERGQIADAFQALTDLPLWMSDKRGMSISEIRRTARQWHVRRPFKVLMIDFIQLIHADKENSNRNDQLDIITRLLHELAGELNVHIVVASQLSRETDKKDNRRPELSHLRDSGGIEQNADNVIGLWRSNYYKDDEDKKGKDKPVEPFHQPDRAMMSEAIILKQREGDTPTVDLGWWGERSMFVNFNEIYAINHGERAA